VKVHILGSSNQIIHVVVSIVGTNLIFNASIIYGDNRPCKREALWYDIVRRS
jgi:hypothetical protein